ncbi:DciA family protein [Plantactinospora sp. GCM10030261]|uniref:DciA family protein n=1 Tax=Plantactinospora sp. GCM10030261 TaxID=3273420 RepID=UPI00361C73A5
MSRVDPTGAGSPGPSAGPSSAGPSPVDATSAGAPGKPAGPSPDRPAGAGKAGDGPAGPELARAVLDAARARRGTSQPGRRTGGSGGSADGAGASQRRRPRGYSGPGPDPRDPQPLGAVLARLVKARGWQRPTAEATVFGSWAKVVGADVAEHSRPVKLVDGELTVEAESTAWATQLRLLSGSLLRQIAAVVGHDVVRRLNIHGPAAPSWSRGPRRVRGRGPRDTYG